jgi:glycolate oxidase FAD binding subunit
MTPDALTIDGVGPMPVERPASAAELGDVVRRCAADDTAVYAVGGGTMLDYGMPPARPGVALSTANLDQVIDFPARDMTITVQAGITIAKLQEITKAEGLWLPIDVPEPDRATLGGAIACNVSGPRRYGYGTFRDYVIGISLVNDRGEETKAGGRVVKNVAGYDLMKLYTGSLGTLGVITQVTLKLRPVPEDHLLVSLECGTEQLDVLLNTIHQTQTRPVSVDLHRSMSQEAWTCHVSFEGGNEAVEWQGEQLINELVTDRSFNPWADRDWQASEILDMLVACPHKRTVLRISTFPSGVAAICRQIASDGEITAHAGSGVIRVSPSADSTMDPVRELLDSLLDVVGTRQGGVTIQRCPIEWKSCLPVWGRPPADLALQKAVKRALDPKGIFNPGRFVTDQ